MLNDRCVDLVVHKPSFSLILAQSNFRCSSFEFIHFLLAAKYSTDVRTACASQPHADACVSRGKDASFKVTSPRHQLYVTFKLLHHHDHHS